MASGGATNLHKRLAAGNYQPMLNPGGTPQAFFPLDELGVNVIEATLWANTGQVNSVAHSLGVTPAAWTAVLRTTATSKAFNITVSEASAANNSVVGVFATGFSIGDNVSIGSRFIFMPPAT